MIQRVSHQSLINNRNTPRELGSYITWDCSTPNICNTNNGIGNLSINNAFTDPYCVWNRGLGRFDVIQNSSDIRISSNGYFDRDRSNWQRYTPQITSDTYRVRGSTGSFEEDLSATSPSDHIIDPSFQSSAPRYRSTSGDSLFTMPASISTGFERLVCGYIKTENPITDGSITWDITQSSSSLVIVPQKIIKIRDDNYYLIFSHISAGTSTSGTLEITLASSLGWTTIAAIWSETASRHPMEYIPRFDNTSKSKSSRNIKITENSESGEYITNCGWLGMSLVLPYSSSDFSSELFGNHVRLQIDSNNFIAFIQSSTNNCPVAWVRNNNISQAFFNFFNTWDRYEKVGAVLTWGFRGGFKYTMLAINGVMNSISTTSDIPTGLINSIQIGGYDDSGISRQQVQRVDVSSLRLHRADACSLSKWYQNNCYTGIDL